jgi:hypothetical protein
MHDNDNPHGADLIFLAELPLGILPPNTADAPKTVTFELPEKPGRAKKRQVTIDAAASLGLPTLVDMQIFVCLMAYTREQGFPERVRFCRSWIARDLGWQANDVRYDRIRLGMERLQSTSYRCLNHYPDPRDPRGRTRIEHEAFHVLDSYKFSDDAQPAAGQPSGWFKWGDQVSQWLKTPQMAQLDFAFFRGLENPLAQAAYRYLHIRHLDGKPVYEENLVEYACERLGLSRNFRWPSELKRTLDPVHAELIEKGFLESVSYERQKREKGQKVVFSFPEPQPAALPASAPEAVDATLEALVAAGITRAVAAALVAEQREECARQLQYLPYREGLQHRAGALRRAIEEAWPAPDAWQQAPKKRRAPRRTPAAVQDPTPAPDPAATAAAFDTWWAGLSEAERAAIDQAVAAELPDPASAGGRHLARHPAARERVCRELRLRLKAQGDGG